jgi:hypothetical protein
MAKAPQQNGSPNDEETGTLPSPEIDGASSCNDVECFWEILYHEEVEEYLRVARQYIKPPT